jgi:hypothetical protein
MKTSFVVLMVISTLLVAAIYSSSTSFVFADVSCLDFDKKTKMCVTSTSPDLYECVKQDDGKWKCTKIQPSANVPPGLADALKDVTAAKAPTNGKILSENEDTGDNMTFSRANISALD